jgi:peptidoglycan L-alanyl-D-glutamate endopeptidase CwlK
LNNFSINSIEQLASCDDRLQVILGEALQVMDCSILEGHRNEVRQNELHANGKTQKLFPDSKHNSIPSKAVDAIPFPIDWEDRERMSLFAGIVIGIGYKHRVNIRWGGDWRATGYYGITSLLTWSTSR